MKKVAIIAVCDFEKKPVGGEVFLLNNLLKEKSGNLEIVLIGLTFNSKEKVGKWINKNINGNIYKFLPVALAKKNIPFRIQVVLGIIKYKKKLKEQSINRVYIHSAELIIPFFYNRKMDIIYHIHGNPTTTLKISRFNIFRFEIFNKAYNLLVNASMKKSKKIIWAANKNKDDYIKSNINKKCFIENKSIVIHSSFDKSLKDFSGENNIFKFNNKNKYLITVGRLNKGKRIDILLKVVSEIEKDISNFNLIVCGDGEERNSLEKFSEELGIKNKVKFLGNVNRVELSYLLRNSDVFVFASESEAMSLVVLESLYIGTPVVSTDVGDISLVVKSDETGEIVDNRCNINEFVEKIKIVIKNGKEYYYENCKKNAKQFSPNVMAEKIYEALYELE